MPILIVNTNVSVNDVPPSFCKEMTKRVAELLSKPESYVCVHVNAGQLMSFGGTSGPCGLVGLESLGAVGGEKNKVLVTELTKDIEELLKIPRDRCFIKITDVPRSDLGFDGKPFA